MNKKEEYLQRLDDIRKEHYKLLIAIELIVQTNDTTQVSVPENPSPCSYEKWARFDETVKHRIGVQLYEKLQSLHNQWHESYMKIIDIYYPKHKGIFKKLLGTKPSQLERDKAQSYLDDLQTIFKEFDRTLATCERRVTALSESKFF